MNCERNREKERDEREREGKKGGREERKKDVEMVDCYLSDIVSYFP
jgi:hypothetical protein